ncbi:uncharacterized protein LOC102671067 [Apis dorsata]|uniref:uncharacterized protein LOC102671067 n=1 Tax=Apis dorsata TaxID=7462 RepID=UPI0003DF5B1A|nr:uncharacterized protein LOC102671067 [Apis dorsata]
MLDSMSLETRVRCGSSGQFASHDGRGSSLSSQFDFPPCPGALSAKSMLRKLLRKRYVFSIGRSYKHGLDLQGKAEESRRLTWGASARNQDLGFKPTLPSIYRTEGGDARGIED